MKTTFNYKEVIDLGFHRLDVNDDVFFNRYGWAYFVVALKLGDITLEWDIVTHEISIYRCNNIISKAITQDELGFILKLIK